MNGGAAGENTATRPLISLFAQVVVFWRTEFGADVNDAAGQCGAERVDTALRDLLCSEDAHMLQTLAFAEFQQLCVSEIAWNPQHDFAEPRQLCKGTNVGSTRRSISSERNTFKRCDSAQGTKAPSGNLRSLNSKTTQLA